jgi:hypothetical protein
LLDQNKFSLKKIGASIWPLEPLLGKAPQRRSLERLFPERGWKRFRSCHFFVDFFYRVRKGFSPRGDGNEMPIIPATTPFKRSGKAFPREGMKIDKFLIKAPKTTFMLDC